MSETALKEALDLPNGAHFFRCAFQVNPFQYLVRQKKTTSFASEDDYNQALVIALIENDVKVIAVADHYRVKSSATLIKTAQDAGITVFPGFEASTKDGIHFLCLFPPGTDLDKIDRCIGDCGIHDDAGNSPIGRHDSLELLKESGKWGAICIGAHADEDNGVLASLNGHSRINVWKSEHLLACAIKGDPEKADEKFRLILLNKTPDYTRDRSLALIHAKDVNGPEDIAKTGATTWVKMSSPSLSGLRQAFLDPESRIRLEKTQDAPPKEILAIQWLSGFLADMRIHFNPNLNVIIGGRGTGKSTIIESIRYALGLVPTGDEAQASHEAIVREVLKNGTKISIRVRLHRPAPTDYTIERTIPNPPVVKDKDGQVLSLSPIDVLGQVEIYGQHEISELTRNAAKQLRLLERFTDGKAPAKEKKDELRRELERSRTSFLNVLKEVRQIDEKLGGLPALQETLKRFQESGLESKLKERSLLLKEEVVFKTCNDRLSSFSEAEALIERELPLDLAFLSDKALEPLPGRAILKKADAVLQSYAAALAEALKAIKKARAQAEADLQTIRKEWDVRKAHVQAEYEKILRELQGSKIDGEEFIKVKKQIEELTPLNDRKLALTAELQVVTQRRTNLLDEWRNFLDSEYHSLDTAAKKVTKKLNGFVRIEIGYQKNRKTLCDLIRPLRGRLVDTINAIERAEVFSIPEFADLCKKGRDALMAKYKIPQGQAEKLCESPEFIAQAEEVELENLPTIQLNISGDSTNPIWKSLDELSKGQKATAILLLLLLQSEHPLIIDQPEDDLDNRFIMEGVVPEIRKSKERRQFIFSTHNANIPVLGDAELIVGLMAVGEAEKGKAEAPLHLMGSIDSEAVAHLVQETLEGGRPAFEFRRKKYGF